MNVRVWRSFRLSAKQAACALVLGFSMSSTAVAIMPALPPDTPEYRAEVRAKAEAGEKYAQHQLATWYDGGHRDVPRDQQQALVWYLKAAEQDHELSQRRLAEMYEFGEGTLPNHAEALHWMGRALKLYIGASVLIAGRYAKTDSRKAIEWCRLSADAGDVSAQDMLGGLYEFGKGTQNFAEAAHWYRKAALSNGYRSPARAHAMMNLGRLYMDGKGVPLDYKLSAEWYQRGISEGNFEARFGLGLLYERGNGVPRDLNKAMELYYDAAPIHMGARDRLFLLYANVFPLPADDAAAVEALFDAAETGDTRAQLGLGLRYKFGKGVPRNWSIAYALFNLAAAAPSAIALPDFTGPEEVGRLWMDASAWQLVDEMQKRGQLRQAITRFESRTRSQDRGAPGLQVERK